MPRDVRRLPALYTVTLWGAIISTETGPNRARGRAVYDDVTDVPLARALHQVPVDTFATLYAETNGALGGYAFQLVRDAEVAADIVQEAYTRLLSRWFGVRKPRPYLFHVVTNLARDAWSQRRRSDSLVREIVDSRPQLSVAPADGSVWDAVERLPKRHREVVLLFYYADLPVTDVASAVRRPPGTVKRMLKEAREQLAATLGGPQ